MRSAMMILAVILGGFFLWGCECVDPIGSDTGNTIEVEHRTYGGGQMILEIYELGREDILVVQSKICYNQKKEFYVAPFKDYEVLLIIPRCEWGKDPRSGKPLFYQIVYSDYVHTDPSDPKEEVITPLQITDYDWDWFELW